MSGDDQEQVERERRDDLVGSIWQKLENEYRAGMIVV
jgi:hypothetical protein